MAAVADAIHDREHGVDGVDAQRVVVVGTSFGGYLALRHAAAFQSGLLRGVVDIAGPYDLRAFDELQHGHPRRLPRVRRRRPPRTEARALLHDVTLDGVLDRTSARRSWSSTASRTGSSTCRTRTG